jgi:hypothetical protein
MCDIGGWNLLAEDKEGILCLNHNPDLHITCSWDLPYPAIFALFFLNEIFIVVNSPFSTTLAASHIF